MKLHLRRPQKSELILLHDSYFESAEPDAPKKPFALLSMQEKEAVSSQFDPDFHFAVCDGDMVVGFVGIYPDDEFMNIGIFYVLIPDHRGKGYFSLVLESLVAHCRQNYSNYRFIRALTRKNNLASIKGLLAASFVRKGECVEELDQPVAYEEFLLPT